MPKQAEFVPKLYQNRFIEVALWAWVQGQKMAGKSEVQSIREFLEYFKIPEDDLAVATAQQKIYRKTREFQEHMASGNPFRPYILEGEKENFATKLINRMDELNNPNISHQQKLNLIISLLKN